MDIGKASNPPFLSGPPQQQLEVEAGTSSSSSSRNNNNINSTLPISLEKRKMEDQSDEDLFTVPDVEGDGAGPADSTLIVNTNANSYDDNSKVQRAEKRHRGRNPVDKEHRRLKRLLRNRVSAQQARERKKVYVNDLESRAKELQDINSKLEEKISTLINENCMLRKVLMNTRLKVDDNTEQKLDQ